MFIVGLTGGIACGKSLVTQILKDNGCAVIDADLIAREVVEVNTKGWRLIRQHFGDDVCLPDGSIDRAKLGEIIFSDQTQRRRLNAITHPLIQRRIIYQLIQNLLSGYRYTFIDAPLLIESKGIASSLLSQIVVVYCNEEQQLERLMARNGFTESEARQRISSQLPLEMKKKMATNELCLIDNCGSMEDTRRQVITLKSYLDRSWRTEVFRITLLIFPVIAFSAVILYLH